MKLIPKTKHYTFVNGKNNKQKPKNCNTVKILMIKISLTQKPPETHGSNIISVTRESVQKPPASDKA